MSTRLQLDMYKYRVGVAFGKVASTGEYKVLRASVKPSSLEQLFEVFTLDGSSNARWRANRGPPHPIEVRLNSTAVINGIVYFFVKEDYWYYNVKPNLIASFDIETEEWWKTLQGPLFRFEQGSFPDLPSNHIHFNLLSLASLNGCLAVVHCPRWAYIDIWFLMNFEKGLWVRQHTIQIEQNVPEDGFLVHPLLVLNDGRIVIYSGTRGLLRIYNPRTTAYKDHRFSSDQALCCNGFVYWKSIEITEWCQLMRQNILLCAVAAVTLIQMTGDLTSLDLPLQKPPSILLWSSDMEIVRHL